MVRLHRGFCVEGNADMVCIPISVTLLLAQQLHMTDQDIILGELQANQRSTERRIDEVQADVREIKASLVLLVQDRHTRITVTSMAKWIVTIIAGMFGGWFGTHR